IRFSEQGKDAILRKDIEGSYKALLRAQRIVMELNSGLRHDVDKDLCGKLAALYNFIYRRLVDANVSKNAQFVDDALEIMRHQRETWVLLMDKLTKEKAAGAQEMVAANADAVASAEEAAAATAPVNAPASSGGPRRAYPAFAVRPAAHAGVATLSVQG
ncbi:MAG TPA: flagellar export chaperone FliS, partial [Phycisphaerae bacterium]|nr:flagellar export chaperone FliS [Phycisphaerae bacterium]